MDQIKLFINDPLVAPLYGLLIVAVLSMLLGVYRSIQQKAFDWAKLPGILDSTVLQKVIPLAALGITTFMVTDSTAKAALTLAYAGGCATALAGEVADFISKATGGFVATTKAEDKQTNPK